jgi:hypothetical protein
MDIAAKWKELVNKMNDKGIPLPMVRDPKSDEGSVMVTLVVVSSALCTITILMMLAAVLSKLSGAFRIDDNTIPSMREAFYSSIQFLIASLGGYLGRKMQRDEKGAVSLEGEDKPAQKE